jgi:hypothetical protein
MTGWDILDKFINGFPPIAATLLLIAAAVVFIVGFSRHGFNFLKYGFGQEEVGDLSKKIDGLSTEMNNLRTEFHTELGTMRTEFHTELNTIKVNHFGHLKNFLCELTSILLDKNVINNTDKARLDNQLRDM